MDVYSDGSERLSTYVMYLLSCLSPGQRDPGTSCSRNCGVMAKTKHHSVSCNEAMGAVMSTEAIFSYIINHHEALFP